MPLTERDYENLKVIIDDHYKAIQDTLKLRKDYWDERIDKLCRAITEMKDHCRRQQDNCAIMFKDFDRRIDENSTDVTKIKTVGSVLALLWGAIITYASHIFKKI